MINKKAQISEGVLILLAVVLCVYSGYAVYTFEKNTADKINSPEKMLGMYDFEMNFEIYGQQAFKLMTHHAYAELMSELQKENAKCSRLADGTLILDDTCIPSKIEDQSHFVGLELEEHYGQFFFMHNYSHKFSMSNNELKIEFDKIKLNVSDKEYNASYSFTKSFSARSPLVEDFTDIYSSMKLTKAECLQKRIADPSFDVIDCSKNFKLGTWSSECKSENAYISCSLSTKNPYFYDESFKPVKIKVALKIL